MAEDMHHMTLHVTKLVNPVNAPALGTFSCQRKDESDDKEYIKGVPEGFESLSLETLNECTEPPAHCAITETAGSPWQLSYLSQYYSW